jgi:DNA invertase Pin-like site-specific DNA recombinase
LALVKGLEDARTGVALQVEPVEVDPAVTTWARENRMLSPNEVAELVEMYRQGATERSLAERFGAHRQTISRHLERAGVAKRPVVKMTEAVVERASKLYAEGWSTQRLGREFGASSSTVYKALVRAGVKLRAPVAPRAERCRG